MKLTNFQNKFFADNPDVIWPLCKCGCGNKVLLDVSNPNSVFRQFASATCSRKSKTVAPNVIELLSNKEWMFEQRITLKKSKETIASDLGISVTPINTWLKKHGLDAIRLNESAHKVQLILNNKDKLETDYSTGKTLAMLETVLCLMQIDAILVATSIRQTGLFWSISTDRATTMSI